MKLAPCACETLGMASQLAPLSKAETAVFEALHCVDNYDKRWWASSITFPVDLAVLRCTVDAHRHEIEPHRLGQLLTHRYLKNTKEYSWSLLNYCTHLYMTTLTSLWDLSRWSDGVCQARNKDARFLLDMCVWAINLGACPAVGAWCIEDQCGLSPLSFLCAQWLKYRPLSSQAAPDTDAGPALTTQALKDVYLATGCHPHQEIQLACAAYSYKGDTRYSLQDVLDRPVVWCTAKDKVACLWWHHWFGRRARRMWTAIIARHGLSSLGTVSPGSTRGSGKSEK
jgi:hypothetical protein